MTRRATVERPTRAGDIKRFRIETDVQDRKDEPLLAAQLEDDGEVAIYLKSRGAGSSISRAFSPEDATQLAAYLVAMAEVGGATDAKAVFEKSLDAAREDGRRYLERAFPQTLKSTTFHVPNRREEP